MSFAGFKAWLTFGGGFGAGVILTMLSGSHAAVCDWLGR